MKLIVLAVLAAVATARADYHDDVFHFSTLRGPVQLAYHQQPTLQHHQYQQYSAVPALASYQQPASYNTYSRQYYGSYQPQYVASQYSSAPVAAGQYVSQQYTTPAVSTSYYATAPNVVLQAPRATVFTSQVPVTTTYSSTGGLGLSGVNSLSSLYSRAGAASTAKYYAPAYSGPQYRILKQVQEVDPSGPYRAHYATENGITASEEGSLVGGGPEGPAVAKQGSYSYTGPDGVQYTVNWVADENGFRASGAHLPQPPEVPAALVEAQRSLRYGQAPASFVYQKK